MNRAGKTAKQTKSHPVKSFAIARSNKRSFHKLTVDDQAHCSTSIDASKSEQLETGCKGNGNSKRGKAMCTSGTTSTCSHSKQQKRETLGRQTHTQDEHADLDTGICKIKYSFCSTSTDGSKCDQLKIGCKGNGNIKRGKAMCTSGTTSTCTSTYSQSKQQKREALGRQKHTQAEHADLDTGICKIKNCFCSTSTDGFKCKQLKTGCKGNGNIKQGKAICTGGSTCSHGKRQKCETLSNVSRQRYAKVKHADSDTGNCKIKNSFSERRTNSGSCSEEKRHMKRTKYLKRRRKLPQSNLNSQDADGESVDTSKESDIPGFYYDKNSKRYFKILASHKGVNIVTKETINIKKREEKRLSDLGTLSSSGKPAVKVLTTTRTPRKPTTDNFFSSLLNKAQGDVSDYRLKSQFLKTEVSRLKPESSVRLFPNPFGIYERLEHMVQMEVNENYDEILGLWPVKETMVQRIQMFHLQKNTETQEPANTISSLGLSVDISGTIVLQSLNKITHMCWAPMRNDASAKYILYTTMCYTGYSPSLARLRNLNSHESASDFSSSHHPIQHTDFRLDKRATWTCAWDATKMQFSIGTEKCSLLVDAQTRRLWELSSNNADVYTQIFSQDGRCFYSGTKKGEILCHDLRSISTKPVITLSLSSPIACLHFLQNDTQFISSCINGKICLWDMRFRHVIQTYHGQVNEYSRIPVHVDDTQTIIYGAGQDCYTRLWCLRTGRLLRSLPPPVACDVDTIPTMRLSQQWGGQWAKRGLLMGLKDRLHFYSMHMQLDNLDG